MSGIVASWPDYATRLSSVVGNLTALETKRQNIRFMLYGPRGAGKTTLAAQVLKGIMSPDKVIIYIDTSEGWVSLKNIPGLEQGIYQVPFTTIEDVRVLATGIRQKVGPLSSVGAIILDEASSMAEMDLDRIFASRQNEGKVKTGQNTPEWEDYHGALARFRQMLSELFAIPDFHVVLISHEKDRKEGATITGVTSKFPRATASKVEELLHLVGHLQADIKPVGSDGKPRYVRTLQVHPTFRVDAKTRMPFHTVTIPAETLPQITEAWLSSGAPETQGEIQPVQDEPTEKPLTVEEMFEAADSSTPTDSESTDGLFVPINN